MHLFLCLSFYFSSLKFYCYICWSTEFPKNSTVGEAREIPFVYQRILMAFLIFLDLNYCKSILQYTVYCMPTV